MHPPFFKLKVDNGELKIKTLNSQLSTLNSKGFTLIELLVVISIIAILVAAATVSWTNAQKKARDNRRKSDLKSAQQALELYFQTNGTYPVSNSGKIRCNADSDTTLISWGSDFSCGAGVNKKTYINPLPKDPKGGTDEYYYYSEVSASDPNKFLKYQISALLENTKDPDNCTSSSSCPNLPCIPNDSSKNISGKSYCVIQP